jgi:hypothetical protein
MPPRPAVDLLCPSCGALSYYWTLPRPGERYTCTDCGADLLPDPPPPDALQFAGASELDAGAAKIRDEVEAMKRKR